MNHFSQRAERFSFKGPDLLAAVLAALRSRCAGRINRDSTREAARTRMITTGILRIILPMVPLAIIKGQKATMVVRTENITGRPTSSVPSTAALKEP